MAETRYIVKGLVSPSFDRVNFPGKGWRKRVIQRGPYKRLKTAKKHRAVWKNDRITSWRGVDLGPGFTRVWIERVEE